jgi:hypothetical protein
MGNEREERGRKGEGQRRLMATHGGGGTGDD